MGCWPPFVFDGLSASPSTWLFLDYLAVQFPAAAAPRHPLNRALMAFLPPLQLPRNHPSAHATALQLPTKPRRRAKATRGDRRNQTGQTAMVKEKKVKIPSTVPAGMA
mmetsp:Transcript_4905/g.14701  ORF Transcript_4905/g.14701 Transcript_4905/m.14701 type:complete len:108 (-) Transcript_4905:459-782(-)